MIQLECKHVTIGYEHHEILENINFSILNGDYVCIFGDNGTGKTTLLKTLLGLLPAVKGTIQFDATLKPTSVGYLPQKNQIQTDFPASVFEIVLSGCLNRLGRFPFYRKKEKEIVNRNMRLLDISALANRPFSSLSGGQQQRVLLARALCATDKMIVLDEPFTGLDGYTAKQLYKSLDKINKEFGVTILIVSHFVEESLAHANKIIHLSKEKIFCGTPQEYVDQYQYEIIETRKQRLDWKRGGDDHVE